MNVVRNLIIGTIAAVLVTALLLVIFFGEGARLNSETKAQQGDSISRGAMSYDAYCAGCHGDRGQGIPGVYPPLNVEDLWSGREEIAFYGTYDDYVTLNISAGHPGQRMPSWSQAYGGPLRDDQIADLTSFVVNWQGPQPPGVREEGVVAGPIQPPEEATPEGPAVPAAEGDPAQGEQVFTQNCSSCHGPDAAGGALGPTLVSADVGAKDDEFLRETISNGRAGTAMPPWGGILSAQDVEDVISFLRSKQP
jgi:mono/diheme cytochrome c family protein